MKTKIIINVQPLSVVAMIEKLKECGLTDYESRVYTALIKEGVSTATKISAESSVPHGKIYPTLFSLEKKGFVKIFTGSPKKFMAIDPTVIFNKLLVDKEKELRDLQQNTQRLIKTFQTTARNKDPLEKVQMVEGFKHFLNVSITLHNETKKIWRSISVLPVFKPHLDAYKRLIKERGGEARVLCVINDKNRANVKIWKKAGIKLRELPELPSTQFSISDEKQVSIRITGGGKYLSILLQNPSLASSMISYFDGLWKTAKKL